MLFGQGVVDVGVTVRGAVARRDALVLQPLEGREPLVVFDCSLEEVDDFFVLDVFRAVAGYLEGAVAGCVFGEFVTPETGKRLDPSYGEVFWGGCDKYLGLSCSQPIQYVFMYLRGLINNCSKFLEREDVLLEQIEFPEWVKESTDVRSGIGRNDCAILLTVGGLWRWFRTNHLMLAQSCWS